MTKEGGSSARVPLIRPWWYDTLFGFEVSFRDLLLFSTLFSSSSCLHGLYSHFFSRTFTYGVGIDRVNCGTPSLYLVGRSGKDLRTRYFDTRFILQTKLGDSHTSKEVSLYIGLVEGKFLRRSLEFVVNRN